MFKKIIIHTRSYAKLMLLIILSTAIITGLILFGYKQTYSVTLNGEFIGYCNNKKELQEKIKSATENGNGENEAFIQIDNMPQYDLCFLKRNIQTNEDEIYKKVTDSGTAYYKMYAIVEGEEEKLYVKSFSEAENVINNLKEKNSVNKDNISILEKYTSELKEFTNIEEAVAKLYKKQENNVVQVASTKTTTAKQVKANTTTNTTANKKINLGISLIKPTNGVITSRFGPRARNNHKGIDIGAPKGTPIYAAASGTVTFSGNRNDGYGNYIIMSNGNGITTYYAHCSVLLAKQGQSVKQGEVIAKVGSTGNSTGNHLHFEIRVNGVAQDPQNYVY